MLSWVKFSDLKKWCNGTTFGSSSDFPISNICTDTRSLKPGDIFLALRGNKFDAHDFIDDAIRKGAKAVISEKKVNDLGLEVKDSLKALISIGQNLRTHFNGPVIAITGSAGKSSTKEMAATLLNCVASPASFNNLMGVSRTLFLLRDNTQHLVLEFGTNAPGEIKELCETFLPNAGLITNIGTAHMGLLGGPQGVFKEKTSLYGYLAKNPKTLGICLNQDDPVLVQGFKNFFSESVNRIAYSPTGNPSDISITKKLINPSEGGLELLVKIDSKEHPLNLPLFGLHHAENLAAALSIGTLCKVDPTVLMERAQKIRPAAHRGEIIKLKDGRILIDESYNSNPSALFSSLESLSKMSPAKRYLIVIGDMFELENYSIQKHEEAGTQIAKLFSGRAISMVGVGVDVKHLLSKLLQDMPNIKSQHCDKVETGLSEVLRLARLSDIIFIKGSRGVGLEKLVPSITHSGA